MINAKFIFILSKNIKFSAFIYSNFLIQFKIDMKKKVNKKLSKGDIIFWKDHVAICLNTKQLIHAYGPEKKVLIMPITKTIKRIKETAKLSVKKISSIGY